jgi:hypothetical protein
VLLFVDNIFRFTQAGSEVSALLGRIPSAVGYQPTLSTEMGAAPGAHHLDEQGLDHLGAGHLRARRRSHRPAPATAFAHLDATTCSRARSPSSASTRPSIRSTRPRRCSRSADRRRAPLQGRAPGAADPAALQGPAGHHRHPRHGRAQRGRPPHGRPRPQDPARRPACTASSACSPGTFRCWRR